MSETEPRASQSSVSKNATRKKLRPRGTVPALWFSLPTELQAMEDSVETELLQEREENRERWGGNISFLLATIGSAVGLGNVWKFPSLAAKNGGAAFVLAYIVVLLFIGLPMMTLELTLGQKFQGGDADAFGAINPRFRGIGLASAFLSFILSTYYTVILAWAMVYFVESFVPNLPYSFKAEGDYNATFVDFYKSSEDHFQSVTKMVSSPSLITHSFNLKAFGAFILIWALIYLCIFKGIRIVSHVVKFTAAFPVIILIILASIGLSREGAIQGLTNYMGTVEWSKLLTKEIWIHAITQSFFSLGLCMGVITAYSSFNPKTQNISRDGKIICISDLAVSLIAGLCVYEMLGFLEHECQRDGLGEAKCSEFYNNENPFYLVFVYFPIGISVSGIPNLIGLMFFVCLVIVGVDSAFSMILAFTTVLEDAWFIKKLKLSKPLLIGAVCVAGFIFGFIYMFDSGFFYLDIADNYVSKWSLMIIGFIQTVACGWIYQASYQFKRVGKFSVILYGNCYFVGILLGVIIALSGSKHTNVDTIWVGIFIACFVWIFGLVAAILLSKGRVNTYREKVWCVAGWHGPDMIRRMVNKQYDPEWEPGPLKDEFKAMLNLSYVSFTFGFLIKYIIPGVLLLLIGMEVKSDFNYGSYSLSMNILGMLILMVTVLIMIVLFVFPRIWYDPKYAGRLSWISWVTVPKPVLTTLGTEEAELTKKRGSSA